MLRRSNNRGCYWRGITRTEEMRNIYKVKAVNIESKRESGGVDGADKKCLQNFGGPVEGPRTMEEF